MRRLLVALVLVGLVAVADAQQNIDRSTNPAEVMQNADRSPHPAEAATRADAAARALQAAAAAPVEERVPVQQVPPSQILPRVWCADINDAETKTVCWKAYRASLQYYETGLAHRARVFTWQHVSTIVIFFTVLALVAAGIFFAWLQFNRDKAAPEQSLELSATGLKLNSPVLGVVILALSLGFFYLYLVYVYPIHELF
jgi:hypothetical protein